MYIDRTLRNRIIALIVLMIAGGAATWAVYAVNGAAFDRRNLPSDVLFAQGSALLIWAFICLIGNFRVFTSFSYGFKQMHAVMQGKPMRGEKMKEDYLTYRKNRPVRRGAGFFGAAGAALLVLSAIVSMI